MKEIGEKLKDAREAMGISTSEAAEDLKLEVSQIENLENGDMENFKDIYYLKYLIRDYSKYLGLDKEDLVNEFNEYLFDYTSKISLEVKGSFFISTWVGRTKETFGKIVLFAFSKGGIRLIASIILFWSSTKIRLAYLPISSIYKYFLW